MKRQGACGQLEENRPSWIHFIYINPIRAFLWRIKKLTYAGFDFYKNESDYKDYEFIEVSDLMENEMKTEILDKLETMNEYLNNKLKKLEEEDDESQKIKKVVYTTEVYFE